MNTSSPPPRDHNPDHVMTNIRLRHQAMATVRSYFAQHEFFEIDSPALIPANCVEAHIDPIAVEVSSGDGVKHKYYLHTSPEIYHKRLLSYGARKIYQLGHVFRNGELGRLHLPEFSLLEWYRAEGSLDDLIADCESLFASLALALAGTTKIRSPKGSEIDLSVPFERADLEHLWRLHANIELRDALEKMDKGDHFALVAAAERSGFALRDHATFEDAFHHIMLTKIEPAIGKEGPVVVQKWPKQLACLSKICRGDRLFAERFEIYCDQIELANAFAELTDPVEQRRRFEDEIEMISRLGKSAPPIDRRFLADLAFMPESVGIAVGFDRLLMLIAGHLEITNVFPLRPSF